MWRPGQLVDPVRIPYYASVRVQALHYDTNLPSTSVVIIFTNEAWSPLIRTIYSVLNRSPPQATLVHHHAVQFLLQKTFSQDVLYSRYFMWHSSALPMDKKWGVILA
jgi:hypothetical protein